MFSDLTFSCVPSWTWLFFLCICSFQNPVKPKLKAFLSWEIVFLLLKGTLIWLGFLRTSIPHNEQPTIINIQGRYLPSQSTLWQTLSLQAPLLLQVFFLIHHFTRCVAPWEFQVYAVSVPNSTFKKPKAWFSSVTVTNTQTSWLIRVANAPQANSTWAATCNVYFHVCLCFRSLESYPSFSAAQLGI